MTPLKIKIMTPAQYNEYQRQADVIEENEKRIKEQNSDKKWTNDDLKKAFSMGRLGKTIEDFNETFNK